MESSLSPAKVVLLAVHFASQANIDALSHLASTHPVVLRQDLLLRIILTYLPETVKSATYVGFLKCLSQSSFQTDASYELDLSSVQDLSEEQASRKVKKLRLLHFGGPDAKPHGHENPMVSFLFERACRVDEEAGMIAQLPDLLLPFIDHAPAIRTWLASIILPLLRRDVEYYPEDTTIYTIRTFQKLSDQKAVEYLLGQTGQREDDYVFIGRDFDGLIGPWLHNDLRWNEQGIEEPINLDNGESARVSPCPGWDHVLEWLLSQASQAWGVTVAAMEQWNGPAELPLAPGIELHHSQSRRDYLQRTYRRAALASAYVIPEQTLDAINGAHRILNKAAQLMGEQPASSLQDLATNPPDLAGSIEAISFGPKLTGHMRNDLLSPSNLLTKPNTSSTSLLLAIILSAYISTNLGVPCSIRYAGDLAFLQEHRDQKAELAKLIRSITIRAPRNDDEYWLRARQQLLWLQCWGTALYSEGISKGFLGAVAKSHIETEFLKALLSNSRYTLAKAIYEDAQDKPLSPEMIREAVYASALSAFDNASNPSRSRGGLKKCDEMLHAFPATVEKSSPMTRRIEALLKATHALSEYRLMLKQGEPFSPVVLRVHSDPISVIEKVLEQNLKAYTRLQEFLEMGNNMVLAGLTSRKKSKSTEPTTELQHEDMRLVEKRIVAMCIEAALREDDFETAYSYVSSRLGGPSKSDSPDEWSFSAALKAGQYIRTERSLQPTHLGTASGNLEIRHLEQRIDCLATALRVAPSSQLLDILKSFRRCEEQLDSAIKEEAAKEAAWDAAADVGEMPGAFDVPGPQSAYPPRNMTASTAARQTEEAPMSLFDLSRATAKAAQKNLTALSSLQEMGQGILGAQQPKDNTQDAQHVRKRDQFREAATERLVSGVGWLIGANVNRAATPESN